jgi:hypothetical protein
MNEKESPSVSISSRPKDDVWELTEQWMSKINAAYDNYRRSIQTYQRNIFLLLVVVVATAFLVTALFSFKATMLETTGGIIVSSILSAIAILFLVGATFDAVTSFRNVRTSVSDLADIYVIANELFQMVISTEEKKAGSRYEYLVNHIRILEIKHLLQKVKGTVGRLGARGDFEFEFEQRLKRGP